MKRFIFIFLAMTLGVLVGCSSQNNSKTQEKPNVVVSIPPYISLVKGIVGETMNVASALGPGFDPHTAEATPKQMKLVQDADLFIGVGEGYERKLLGAIREGSKNVHILEMDEKIPLLSYSRDTNFVDACHDTNLPLSRAKDLHFWLGHKHLILQVEILIEVLSELKPENTSQYTENGHALIKKIRALNKELHNKLHLFQKKSIIVSHAALGYFCDDFNLVQIAVECEGKSPLPKDISRILDLAENSEVICVFTGPQFNNKGAQMVAEKLNLRMESFDPLAEDVLGTIEKIGNDIAK